MMAGDPFGDALAVLHLVRHLVAPPVLAMVRGPRTRGPIVTGARVEPEEPNSRGEAAGRKLILLPRRHPF